MESEIQVVRDVVFNKDLCIFCQDKGKLAISKEHGCAQVRLAAKNRLDDFMLLRLANFSEEELFYYHMNTNCYKNYVHKLSIERFRKKQIEYRKSLNSNESQDSGIVNEEESQDSDVQEDEAADLDELCDENNTVEEESSNISDDRDVPPCLICNQIYHKGVSARYRICTKKRAENLFNIAQQERDILKSISQFQSVESILQNNIYYHKNCLRMLERKYTKNVNNSRNDSEDDVFIPKITSSPIQSVKNCKQIALRDAVTLIMPRVRAGECFTLTEVCKNVNKNLESKNICVKNVDVKNFLTQNHSDEILFSVPTHANKPTLFYHSSLTVEMLINAMRSQNHIKKTAQVLKESMKDIHFDLDDKFCDENDLRNSWKNIEIPTPFLMFFSELFNFSTDKYLNSTSEKSKNNDKKADLSEMKILKMKSLFQIIYYISNKGKKQTPLHIMTGLAVHNVCKSSALIKSLNRTGISISYDEVQRIRSRLASFTAESCNVSVPLPSHFHPNKFTIAAFDNFDHNEATDSGLNSTHDTVSVLFQDKSDVGKSKPNISETSVDKRSRCFDQELQCQQIKNFQKPSGKINFSKGQSEDYNFSPITEKSYKEISKLDFIWNLCRMNLSNLSDINTNKDVQETPPWAAFNSLISTEKRPTQIVGFLPILPFPVTQYSTVYTAMCNFKSIHLQLEQKSLPLFCDEGVYHIARHIKLVREEEFENIVVMLGGFHMIKVVLACVGKYLKGSGVEHLFIETEAFGVSVVDQVLNGTNYARSTKGFFMLAETLRRLQIEAFFKEHKSESYEIELSFLQSFQETLQENSINEGKQILHDFNSRDSQLHTDFVDFVNKRSEESELFKYWNNVLQMIQLVKNLLRADRSGNWDLHIETVKKIQPLFQIMDRNNYSRWSSIYLSDILSLEKSHPELNKQFKSGKFTLNRSEIPYTSVAPDQGLEQTINRSKKSTAGIIGSTQKKIFVAAWDLVYHEVLATTNLYREMTLINNDNYELRVHHEFSKNKIDNQESLIQDMIKFTIEHVNPFECGSQPLRNIITEELPDPKVKDALLNVYVMGCDTFKQFWLDRIVNKSKSICTTISRINLPFFNDRLDANGFKKSVRNEIREEKNTQRIVDLAKERNFPLENLLTYELSHDNFLFESDAVLRKEKSKSLLIKEIEKIVNISDYSIIPDIANCNLIVDVMLVCRKISWKNLKCFKDFGFAFCNYVKKISFCTPGRIDFVFDSYFEKSPKNGERQRRYNIDSIDLHKITEDMNMPKQDGPFWASTKNKILLQEFLRDFIQSQRVQIWPAIKLVYSTTNNNECIASDSCYPENLKELETSDIEEADVKIIPHLAHAVMNGYDKIVVLSADTDVLVLLIYYCNLLEKKGLKELWNLRFNSEAKQSILPVHSLAQQLGLNLCKVLPALHHLTGSDYTSKVGTKHSGMQANPEKFLLQFAQDSSNEAIERDIQLAEQYLVQVLYKNNTAQTFDQLRYSLYYYGQKRTISELPPTSKSIKYHILRAFYATYNQITCLDKNRTKLEILDFGYNEDDGLLIPQKSDKIYPSTELLVPNCNCRKCAKKTCRCIAAGISCCKFCLCQRTDTCKNPVSLV